VINRFRKWWNAERVNRPERGTSQDICPTNGDAIKYAIGMMLFWALFATVFIAAIQLRR